MDKPSKAALPRLSLCNYVPNPFATNNFKLFFDVFKTSKKVATKSKMADLRLRLMSRKQLLTSFRYIVF